MPRESYVKPEVKSEILEPEAFGTGGSGIGFHPQGGGGFWGYWARWSWWW